MNEKNISRIRTVSKNIRDHIFYQCPTTEVPFDPIPNAYDLSAVVYNPSPL
jgi:hypothetical protein